MEGLIGWLEQLSLPQHGRLSEYAAIVPTPHSLKATFKLSKLVSKLSFHYPVHTRTCKYDTALMQYKHVLYLSCKALSNRMPSAGPNICIISSRVKRRISAPEKCPASCGLLWWLFVLGECVLPVKFPRTARNGPKWFASSHERTSSRALSGLSLYMTTESNKDKRDVLIDGQTCRQRDRHKQTGGQRYRHGDKQHGCSQHFSIFVDSRESPWDTMVVKWKYSICRFDFKITRITDEG